MTQYPIDTANEIDSPDNGLWLLSDQAVQMAFDSGILDTDTEIDVIEESEKDISIEHIDYGPPSPTNIDSEAARSWSYSSSVASVIGRLKVKLANESMDMENNNCQEHQRKQNPSSVSYSKTIILESPSALSTHSNDPILDEGQRTVAYRPSIAILKQRLKYSTTPRWLSSHDPIKGENLLATILMEGAQAFCDVDIHESQAKDQAIVAFSNTRAWCSMADKDRFTAIRNCHRGNKGKRKAIAQHLINLRARFKAEWTNKHANSQSTNREAIQQKYLPMVAKYILSKARVKTRGHLFLLSFLAAVFLLIPPHRKKQIEATVALMNQCKQA